MAEEHGPWENYQPAATEHGPWEKYASVPSGGLGEQDAIIDKMQADTQESGLSRFGKSAYGMTPLPLAAPATTTGEKIASVGGPVALAGYRMGGGLVDLAKQVPGAVRYWAGAVQHPERTMEELSTIKPELGGMLAGGLATAAIPHTPAIARGTGAVVETAGRIGNVDLLPGTKIGRFGPVTPARLAGGIGGAAASAAMKLPGYADIFTIPAGAAAGEGLARGLESMGSKLRAWGGYEPPAPDLSGPLLKPEEPLPKLSPRAIKAMGKARGGEVGVPQGGGFGRSARGMPSQPDVVTPDIANANSLKVEAPNPKPNPNILRKLRTGSAPAEPVGQGPSYETPRKMGRMMRAPDSGVEGSEGSSIIRPGGMSRIVKPGEDFDAVRQRGGALWTATNERVIEQAEAGDEAARKVASNRGLRWKGMPSMRELRNMPMPNK